MCVSGQRPRGRGRGSGERPTRQADPSDLYVAQESRKRAVAVGCQLGHLLTALGVVAGEKEPCCALSCGRRG
jgi:hypothetical protein